MKIDFFKKIKKTDASIPCDAFSFSPKLKQIVVGEKNMIKVYNSTTHALLRTLEVTEKVIGLRF